MKRNIIRLTESDLHNIIKQSVKRIIREETTNNEMAYVKNELLDTLRQYPDEIDTSITIDGVWSKEVEGTFEFDIVSDNNVEFFANIDFSMDIHNFGYEEQPVYDVESPRCGPGGWVDPDYEAPVMDEKGPNCKITYKIGDNGEWRELPLDGDIVNAFKENWEALLPDDDNLWEVIDDYMRHHDVNDFDDGPESEPDYYD